MTPILATKFGELVVEGKRLETLWLEPRYAAAPAVVMLHEGLGSIALWRDFPHALAERTGCGVLVYSRYGHGGSDKQAEKRQVTFMHHEGEVVLPELLDKMGIEKPILLGHSDGGSIALIFAGKYPERTRGLILEAPHIFVENLSVASIAATKVSYETTNLRARLGCYHANVDATFRAWNDIWLDPQFPPWNIESYLETIRCPVLCIQGEEDEYGTRAQVDAIVARVSGAELLMLPSCGHSPHRDQREATLAKMAEFVEKIKGKPSITTYNTDLILKNESWQLKAKGEEREAQTMAEWINTFKGAVLASEYDSTSHMNSQMYVSRFDQATWFVLRAIGVTPVSIKQQNLRVAIVRQNYQFLEELRGGELVEIKSGFVAVGEKYFRFLHQMFDAESGRMIATCDSVVVRASLETGKSVLLTPELQEKAKQYLVTPNAPLDENVG